MQPVIVYGPITDEEDFAFLEEPWAREVMLAWAAVNHAKTWREFWQRIPQGQRECLGFPACVHPEAEGEEPQYPNDDTSFDMGRLSSNWNGEYPTLAHINGDYWMPQELQDEYSNAVQSFLSGSWNVYPPERAEELAEELRRRGYAVRRDDELIKYSCSHYVVHTPDVKV